MKRYLIYLLALILLSGVVGAALFKKYYKNPDQLASEFALKEEAAIEKIVLTDNKGKVLSLSKQSGTWMVNNKHEARPELMQYLMEAITRISSLAPVPNQAYDNVVRDLMNEHIKVQIYAKDGELLKAYWVGDASIDSRGTYMLMEIDGKPASRPHICYLPGYQGYITPRFNTEEEVWRSRRVFAENESNIQALKVEYFATPEKSFQIARITPDSLQVGPLAEQYRINEKYEQKYVKQYLDFYSSIHVEAYDNTYSAKDSLLQTVPYCTLTLITKDKEQKQVKLYRMPYNKRSKTMYDLQGKEIDYDVDRFYASVNEGKDFAIVQFFVFGKLLREYREFFFKPA